jgi:DNA-binding transcriptional LysR family regulator
VDGPAQREVACFVRVASSLSFSRAAASLGMSQPAVSQAVARLERSLGVRLFERSSRSVRLTDDGKVLLPYAEGLLEHTSAFLAEAARLASAPAGTIRLAYCPVVAALAARVVRRLPSVEVELVRVGWAAASALLTSGSVAAALMTTPFPAGMVSTARFSVPLTHVALPAAAPLARASSVSVAQLAGSRVLVPRHGRALSPAFLPADLEDLPASLDLVAAGRCALVAPGLLAETVRRPDVAFVPLAVRPAPVMTYGLAWSAARAPADLMALVQTVRETLRVP